jgi:hypothetical protein
MEAATPRRVGSCPVRCFAIDGADRGRCLRSSDGPIAIESQLRGILSDIATECWMFQGDTSQGYKRVDFLSV